MLKKDTFAGHWTTQLRKVFFKYKLPIALQLVSDPPAKLTWKATVKAVIKNYWNRTLKEEAVLKKSLRFLNLEACAMGFSHPVGICSPNPMQALKLRERDS